jgi:hypothetical protein
MAKKPLSQYTEAELLQALQGNDPYPEAPRSGIIRRTLGDTGVGLAKSAVSLGEMGVGIANLATLGGAGALAKRVGYDANAAREAIGEYYSPEAKEALGAVEKAKGFRGTLGAILERPSSIGLLTAESAAPMLAPIGAAGAVAKGALRKGLTQAQAIKRAGTTAAVGEGAATAGSVAEDIRNQGGDYGDIAMGALPAGAATALLGQFAGKLTGGPLEAVLARRAVGKGASVGAMPTAGVLGGAALGAVVEGTEEALQGVSEQGFTNLATDKDFLEGAGKSAALGIAVGAPLGAVLGGISPQQLSADGLSNAPVDPLGDQREAFTEQLNVLKAQYADAVAAGTPAQEAYGVYLTAAENLKQSLLTPAAVPEEVIANAPVDPEPSVDLLDPDEAGDFMDSPMADVLDALGEDATGSKLVEALKTADPDQLAQLKNAIMMAAAEGTQDEQFTSMLRDALEDPDTAEPAVFDAALQGMREAQDRYTDQVAADVQALHPELFAELEAAPPKAKKVTKAAALKARLDPVAQAAASAADSLDIQELTAVPKTARATLGKKLAEATAKAILGDKVAVVRGPGGEASKAGTVFVARVADATKEIVDTARRLDRLSAKVSPRITESTTDIAKKRTDVATLLDRIKNKSASEDELISEYTALRKALASTGRGRKPDPAAIKFYAEFKDIVNKQLPMGSNTNKIAGVVNGLTKMQAFLESATAGRNVTGGKTDDGGASLAELNDSLYRQIERLLALLGDKKNSPKARAAARANLDKIIGAYKTEKYARNAKDAEVMEDLDDEFGEFATDEGGEAADKTAAKERNKHDRMLSMAWAAYKDGRISRIRNIKTGRTDSPLSSVPDRPIRKAKETGMAEDASKSPLADVYREGFVYTQDKPDNATPPGTRAVLSYLAQTNTPMTRTLANMLKEVLVDRMPRKGALNPKNPLRMQFLTPEEATRLGVNSARWYSKAAYEELRKTNPDMPAGGEMILVARATPEAILHEMLHGATASWVQSHPSHDTVVKLSNQLDVAIKKFEELTKDGIPTSGPLQAVYQTLESVKRAGDKKGLSPAAAKANRVAEFISYAMTRASFQEFLAAINVENIADSNIAYTKKEESLFKTMGNVFNAFIDVLRTLLGVKATENTASARFEKNREFMTYLVNRVVLVNRLAVEQPAKGKGSTEPLDMDTISTLEHEDFVNMTAEQAPAARAALPPRKRNLLDRLMAVPFEVLGGSLWKNDSKGVKDLEARASEAFTKFMRANPTMASIVGNFVEYVGVSGTALDKLQVYMRERNSANYLGNLIEDALEGMSREDQMVFMEALTEPAQRGKLSPSLKQLVIDTERAIIQLRDKAAASGGLAPELKNAGLNEMIQYAIDRRNLATKGFSANVIKLSKQRVTANTNVASIVQPVGNDPSSPFDDRYYPVYAKADPTKIDYFIASSQVAELKAAGADTTASWSYSKRVGDTAVFVRNKTFAEIQEDYPNVPLTHYLANTLAEMSKVVAGRQLVDSLLDIDEAAATADKIIFADEGALKAAFGDKVKTLVWDNVELSASQKNAARRPDYWVKVEGDKYGKLSGQYINGSMFAALEDMHSDGQFISSPKYNALLRFWKGTKTKLSPGTHATNTISNITMLYMHDIPLAKLRQSAGIYYANSARAKGKGALTKEQQRMLSLFNASGAVLGNYSQNELHRKMADAITKNMLDDRGESESLWNKTLSVMGYEKDKAAIYDGIVKSAERLGGSAADIAKRIDKAMGAAYEMEDNVFRFAAFLSESEIQTGLGKTEAEATEIAGRFAQYAMIDYSINARGINALRQTALPFLAWTYRAIPMMVRVGYTKPWKIMNLMTAYYAINALSYASLGDEADEEEERARMPDYMQQRVWGAGPQSYVRMPWGDKDNPVFWGAGKYLPGGDLIQSSERGAFGMPYWPAAATPSGPAVAVLMSAIGYDSFQGRSLWDSNNDWKQNAAASFGYVMRQMAPVSPDKAIYDMYRDKEGLVGNDINHMYAVSRYFGSRLYQRNASEDNYTRSLEIKAMQREFRAGIAKLARSEARYGTPDWDEVQEQQQEMAARFMEKVNKKMGNDNG